LEKVIVFLSHGSRSEDFQKGFNQIIDLVKEKRKDLKIYGANMELCSPTLEETIEKIVKEDKDITKIGIVPFFLFEGIHIKEDIPEIEKIIEEEQKKYKDKIVTEIDALDMFYDAEDYHQEYLQKNPDGYCHINFSLIKPEEKQEPITNH